MPMSTTSSDVVFMRLVGCLRRTVRNHEFLQNSTSIWSNLDNGVGPGFNYRTISPSRDSVFAGAGLIAQLGRNWNASVYYNTDFGSATSDTHIVSASVGYIW